MLNRRFPRPALGCTCETERNRPLLSAQHILPYDPRRVFSCSKLLAIFSRGRTPGASRPRFLLVFWAAALLPHHRLPATVKTVAPFSGTPQLTCISRGASWHEGERVHSEALKRSATVESVERHFSRSRFRMLSRVLFCFRGAVEVRGHIFPPSSSYRLVSSPPWSPTVRMMALKPSGPSLASMFRSGSRERNGRFGNADSAETSSGCPSPLPSAGLPDRCHGDNCQTEGNISPRSNARGGDAGGNEKTKDEYRRRTGRDAKCGHEAEKHFAGTMRAGEQCTCVPEAQFAGFTGGDPDSVEAAFVASLQW